MVRYCGWDQFLTTTLYDRYMVENCCHNLGSDPYEMEMAMPILITRRMAFEKGFQQNRRGNYW